MSTQAETIVLPPRFGRRRISFRFRDFPLIPALILGSVAFVAIFADVLAPTIPRSAVLPRGSVRRSGRPAAARNTSSAPTSSGETCCRG